MIDHADCQDRCIHRDTVRLVKPELERLPEIAPLFKALGDDTRSRIAFALSKHELCVCDLAALLDITPQAVSYHLRLLRALRLVKYRRDGQVVYYSLDDDHVVTILTQAIYHLQHS